MKPITAKNLTAYDGGGEASTPAPETGLVTLDADDHYFPIFGADECEIDSIHILTGAAIEAVFTVETCNFPRRRDEVGPADVTDYNETTGNWIKENPSSAYVASTGTGWAVAALTLTKTAGAGGAMIHLGNMGARRVRLKAAVTTPGTIRVVANGKG
jgi:hypothetical protein